MWHLRAMHSTRSNPQTRCGAEPEWDVIIGKDLSQEGEPMVEKMRTPKLVEFEYVKRSADNYNICEECVRMATAGLHVTAPNPDGSHDDEVPF